MLGIEYASLFPLHCEMVGGIDQEPGCREQRHSFLGCRHAASA
ncbi:hypothetical protein [Methylicorpusculum sp.]|nr:hypothetical protein [Methylicorpusculum sp.]MDZ4154119.1 hypothetical protein [Methylicorpusculum sp.]